MMTSTLGGIFPSLLDFATGSEGKNLTNGRMPTKINLWGIITVPYSIQNGKKSFAFGSSLGQKIDAVVWKADKGYGTPLY